MRLLSLFFFPLLLLLSVVSCDIPSPFQFRGTFIDVAYDRRLMYANELTWTMDCPKWEELAADWGVLGVTDIIFQAVHDARWGAYYPSTLPFLAPWNGTCLDVVGSVIRGAERRGAVKIWLSCEFVGTESDSITDPTIMAKRIKILGELSGLYGKSAAFGGWYFGSEAFINPYFSKDFLAYITTLSSVARALNPYAPILTSPFGTRNAVNDPTFVAQLKAIDVDIIAYQDEVGCVRDEYPIAQVEEAWKTLAAAHAAAGRPRLWANIESFTWEGPPNNVTSPLVPAAFPRILSQVAAAQRAGITDLITFTLEGLYRFSGDGLPWASPYAGDLGSAYFLQPMNYGPTARQATLNLTMTSTLIGAEYTTSPCTPGFCSGDLTDGLTGPADPFDPRWLGLSCTAGAPAPFVKVNTINSSGGFLFIQALQVPPTWYLDGNANKPKPRNVTAMMPRSLKIEFEFEGDPGWTTEASPSWFMLNQTTLDVYTDLFIILGPQNATSMTISAPSCTSGSLFLSEIAFSERQQN
jgi:hypothetical protein